MSLDCSTASKCLKNKLFTFIVPDNASRACLPDGTWHNYSDFTKCPELNGLGYEPVPTDYTYHIYIIGYSISLIALFVSLAVFLYFK